MSALLRLMRPHQWLKSSFVFFGLLFSYQWNNLILVRDVLFTAIAFSWLSSAIYIFNDIIDKQLDKMHPEKKSRPIAAGIIAIKTASGIAIALGVISLLLGFWVSQKVFWILFSYILLNVAYSLVLKHYILLDVFAISAGFLLRILAGTVGVGIPPSGWLLLCSLMLTLFLGFSKRRAERRLLENFSATLPTIIQQYSVTLLDQLLTITACSTILSYMLYALYQDNTFYHHTHHLIYTVPFAIYGVFRYLYLSDNNKATQTGLDFSYDIWHDKPLLSVVIIWVISIISLGFL